MKEFTDFTFHMYTEIVFGKQTEKRAGELIRKHGGTKVMLVYGVGSIKKSGLYDTIVQSLRDSSLDFIELGGVQPNPRRSLAEKASGWLKMRASTSCSASVAAAPSIQPRRSQWGSSMMGNSGNFTGASNLRKWRLSARSSPCPRPAAKPAGPASCSTISRPTASTASCGMSAVLSSQS